MSDTIIIYDAYFAPKTGLDLCQFIGKKICFMGCTFNSGAVKVIEKYWRKSQWTFDNQCYGNYDNELLQSIRQTQIEESV